tara:strand:+ start:139905 stop:141473 length:1569 start_codon:yes stop_codon:yes gene_type:complete
VQALNEKLDALIIGAGAAGSVCAARLAQAGKQVRILEMGPQWTPGDLISSQIWGRRLKWGGPAVLPGGEHYFAHNAGMGWGSGGAALHHYGTWPRLHPEVFEQFTRHGRGHDWPFDYAELQPWYDKVQEYVGISGDAEQEIWRGPGKPYPMPPIKTFAQGELIAAGFRKLGKNVSPLPLIINSTVYNNRPACQYDGWCDAGCPIGALGNPLFTYLGLAQQNGVQISNDSAVTEILCDSKGRPEGVRYSHGGEAREAYADVIIIAGSVVQTPRLLLHSRSAEHPAGIGNSGDMVGKYLAIECMIGQYGLFSEKTDNHMGVNAGQLTHREGFLHKDRPGVGGGLQWQIGPSQKPNDLFGIAATRPDLMGDELHRFIRDGSRHLASMVGFGGGVAGRENRVELSTEKDRHGMPLPRLVHTFDEDTKALWRYMAAQGSAVFKAAGASQQWQGRMNTGHITGGTIMGKNSQDSVCDGVGRIHDTPNLFIAGGGLIPACNGVSPTYTITALAERTAGHLVDNWGRYAA